jgi:predicted TIM-barrel fold metal-dependent hydrolase
MSDLTAAFMGITTPVSSLYNQISNQGWEALPCKWDSSLGAYTAEAKSPNGDKITKTGPNENTAIGNLLVAIMRHNHIRTAAQYKIGMWKTMFTDQLKEIAEAYSKAPVYDPKAAAAFKELADDSVRRAEVLKQQLHIEVVDDPEPYASSQEMAKDIHENKHFLVSRANSEHPLWSVDQNVAFRIVHDVMGHAVSGGDFGWQGENLACAAHFPLLSPNAQQALFTECIAQTGYAAYYRSFGPQKVALFPQFTDPTQAAENQPGHMGVHPSQMAAPTSMPNVPASPDPEKAHGALPEGSIAPHEEALGLTPVMGPSTFSKRFASLYTDPNAGWSSGISPMSLETHGVGNAYLDHGDPLESQAVMDNAQLIDTGWHSLTKGDGSFDADRAKQAIVNAFRVVLLSPRKDLRWNAIHYQDIAHVPASTDDPKQYWDTLETKRRNWNQAQGIDPNAHMIYFPFLKPFQSIIYQLNPELGFEGARKKAEQTLFNWWTEEQQRIEAEDAEKPSDKQRGADEIERRANEALAKRLQVFIKDKTNPKTDVPDHTPEPLSLFGHTSAEQYNLLTGQPALKYGAFMGTHLKAISQISKHADSILKAAMEDVQSHDGAGHHFRAAVLNLGISGVGPKVCSFAWLLLQPMTSQLATIDTHMMDVLGHNYDKEMNNRDYFKFERELAAGRDAAGYNHVPLGAFQWGMWDHKRTGPGSHQDHSAMRVLDPVPHTSIDWVGKAQNLKGDSWLQQAPDWWQNTQDARDAVARQWDEGQAKQFPQNAIPFQVGATSKTAKPKHSDNGFHVGFTFPEELFSKLADIAAGLEMDEAEDPALYHVTAFWSKEGYDRQELHEWIRDKSISGLRFENARLDCFPSDDRYAVVLRLDAPEAKVLANELMDEAEAHGLEIKRFPGGWKPHITLGWVKEKISGPSYPEISFRAGPLYVSVPSGLRNEAEAERKIATMEGDPYAGRTFEAPGPWITLEDGEQDMGAPRETIMQFARLNYPHLSTPEIWALLGEDGAGKSNR